MTYSIDSIVALINRKEPLPSEFNRALKNVVSTALNRGIYTLQLGELITNLKLDLPKDMVGDYNRYFDCEYLYKIVSILDRSGVSMLPPKVPRNIGEANVIYLLRKPDLMHDQDICKLQEVANSGKPASTNGEIDAINRAKTKLYNFNIVTRIFEYLGAAQLRPLDANQRSYLNEELNRMLLPHDCDRYVRSMYSYACDCGSFNYDFSNPKYVSRPMSSADTEIILTIIAKSIAPSHHNIRIPDDFPYKDTLKRFYRAFCPEIYNDSSTEVREKSVRVPVSERPLSTLTAAQRRTRLKNYLARYVSKLSPVDGPYASSDSSRREDKYSNKAMLLFRRMGYSEEFLKLVKELYPHDSDHVPRLVNLLNTALKKSEHLRLMLPDFTQTRLVVYTPNRSHAHNESKQGYGYSMDALADADVQTSDENAAREANAAASTAATAAAATAVDGAPAVQDGAAIAAVQDRAASAAAGAVASAGSKGANTVKGAVTFDATVLKKIKDSLLDENQGAKRGSYTNATSAAYRYTTMVLQNAGVWSADAPLFTLIKGAQLNLDENSAGVKRLDAMLATAPEVLNKTGNNIIQPSFSATSESELESLAEPVKRAHNSKVKASAKAKNYRIVPFVFDRLTYLYHSYMIWSKHKEQVLDSPSEASISIDDDYGASLERFLKNPMSQEDRFNKIAAYELILRYLFGKGPLACALNNKGDSDANELQRFFDLVSRDYALLAEANPIPFLFYHSVVYFDKYLQSPHTHFNNELFYLILLSKEPFAINIYLSRIIRKYGHRLADIPKEFYTLIALWLLLFPPVKQQFEAAEILISMLQLNVASDNAQLYNVVVLRDLAHRLYMWVQAHKEDEAKELVIELVRNYSAPDQSDSYTSSSYEENSEFGLLKDDFKQTIFNDSSRLLTMAFQDNILRESTMEADLADESAMIVSDIADHDMSRAYRSSSVHFVSECLRGKKVSALKVAANLISDAASMLATILERMSDPPDLNTKLAETNATILNRILERTAVNSNDDEFNEDFVNMHTKRFGYSDPDAISKLCKKGAIRYPEFVKNGAISGTKVIEGLLPDDDTGAVLVLLLLTGSISHARLASSPITLKYALQFITNIAVALRGLVQSRSLVLQKDKNRNHGYDGSENLGGIHRVEIVTLQDIDDHIISRLISCSICLSILQHVTEISSLSKSMIDQHDIKTAVCKCNASMFKNCYDRHYGKSSAFADEHIGPLYMDYVKPIVRSMLCNNYNSYYSLNNEVDLSDIINHERIRANYEYSCYYNVEGLSFNRFIIDSFVYKHDPQRFAELKRFALHAETAYDLGFANGIPTESLSSISGLIKKNFNLQLVPFSYLGEGANSYSVLRPSFSHIKLIAIPEALCAKNVVQLYLDLIYSLYCGFISLEMVHCIMPNIKTKGLVELLTRETISIHKLGQYDDCIRFIYEFFAYSDRIIRLEGPIDVSLLFDERFELNGAINTTQSPGRFRHFLTMAFGYEMVNDNADDLAKRRYSMLISRFKFISPKDSDTSKIEQTFQSFDEVTPNVPQPVKFDMDKVRKKIEESKQVQDVITTLREKEEADELRRERIKSIMEANRAEASQTQPAPELEADIAALRVQGVSVKQAAALATAIAEEAAIYSMEKNSDPAAVASSKVDTPVTADNLAADASLTATASAAADTSAGTSAASGASTSSADDSASDSDASSSDAPSEHKINTILNAKLREVIEAIAVQGTDAMVFSEFNGLCVSHGLLSGNYAIEELNNYSFDEYDSPVLELDGEGNSAIVYIDTEVITDMHSHCSKK